ncbi:hypothetical protein, partial [Dietzia sp. KRD202]
PLASRERLWSDDTKLRVWLIEGGAISEQHYASKWGQFRLAHSVINTVGPTLPGTDGLGDWNIPWETWRAGTADQA